LDVVRVHSTGEKRQALLAADAANAEAFDKEQRRRIAENSALSYTGAPDSNTILTPVPATPTPVQPDAAAAATPAADAAMPPAATAPPA